MSKDLLLLTLSIVCLILSIVLVKQQTPASSEHYVAVYNAPIIEDPQLYQEWLANTPPDIEWYAPQSQNINYSLAEQVGVSGYIPGYDSMTLGQNWSPTTDLDIAAKYGTLGAIGDLATGTFTKAMNV